MAATWNKFGGSSNKNDNTWDKQLEGEINEPIIIRKVQSTFMGNIWGLDLAEMQLISKFNKKKVFYYCSWYFW